MAGPETGLAQFVVNGQLDDVSTLAATENDYAPWRITPQRAGHVNLRNQAGTEIGTSSNPVRTDPTGTTPQPSSQSGTWTTGRTWILSNGTDSIAAVESGTWVMRMQDGSGNALASSTTTPSGTEQGLVVRNIPSGTQTVTGTIAATQGTSPWVTSRNWTLASGTDSVAAVQSGNFVVRNQDGAGNNLVSSTTTPAGTEQALIVRNIPSGTQTISGTVTANVGTTGGLALDATVSTGNSTLSTINGKLNDNYGAASGALRVASQVGNASGVADFGAGATSAQTQRVVLPTDQSAIPVTTATPWSTNVAQFGGTNVNTGTGTSGTGTPRVTVSSDSSLTSNQGTAAAIASAWPVKNTDGTNVAAVKAASTAAVATDPAAVVTLSPNGNQATAANQATEIAALQIIDNLPHANNVALNNGVPIMGQLDDTSTGTVTEDNVSTVRITTARGLHTNLRNATGTEVGTTANPLTVTSMPSDGTKSSYSASFSGLVSVASATDIACLTGSGSKTIRITHVEVSGTTSAGSGQSINVAITKHSSANTGGTSSALTLVPHDSTNAAATASAVSYTANPIIGTSVGAIRSFRLDLSSSGVQGTPAIWDFGTRPSQSVVLRGITQQACINFGTVTITGPVIDGSFEFTEE